MKPFSAYLTLKAERLGIRLEPEPVPEPEHDDNSKDLHVEHGRISTYRKGCRCEDCREVKREERARYRAEWRGDE